LASILPGGWQRRKFEGQGMITASTSLLLCVQGGFEKSARSVHLAFTSHASVGCVSMSRSKSCKSDPRHFVRQSPEDCTRAAASSPINALVRHSYLTPLRRNAIEGLPPPSLITTKGRDMFHDGGVLMGTLISIVRSEAFSVLSKVPPEVLVRSKHAGAGSRTTRSPWHTRMAERSFWRCSSRR